MADNLDLASLKREKDDASEVREGFECGLVLQNYNDIKIGDVVESFEMREIAAQLITASGDPAAVRPGVTPGETVAGSPDVRMNEGGAR